MKRSWASGQSLVELALILPLLLLILLGTVEFGLMYYDYIAIENGAREGARYGVVLDNPCSQDDQNVIAFRVREVIPGYLNNPAITVSCNQDENLLTVVVTYDFHPFDPILAGVLGRVIRLKAQVTLTLEE